MTALGFRMDNEIGKAMDIVREIDVPMTLADPDLDDCPLIYSNKAFENLTGFSGKWSQGKNCRFLQGEKTDKDETIKIKIAVERRLACVSALTNYMADGSEFHNLLSITPILLNSGKFLLVGCQFKFDLGVELETIRRNAYERQQKIQLVSGRSTHIALQQEDALKMRADAATMRVTNYLRIIHSR